MSRRHNSHHRNTHRNNARRTRSGHRTGSYPLGKLEVSHQGYGFVDTDEGSFFIPANRMGGAFNGDTVEVRPGKESVQEGHKRRGVVARVHHRATEYLTGTLEFNDALAVVIPSDPRIHHDVFVTTEECPEAVDGDVVLARITTYPDRRTAAQGYVVEVVGHADQPGLDIDMIVHNAGVPLEFSSQALEQAEGIEVGIEEALADRSRVDLRERDVFTIDPADAKDFDDAISIDRVDGKLRLGVHIADVASYVEWDTSIDICARDRGTSTYLPDRVLPMLPPVLSDDVCSLRPGEDRRAMTCDMIFDDAGHITAHRIYTSVIRSRRRFTYEEAQAILDGEPDPYAEQLMQLHELADMLAADRVRRGGLDFDSVEAKPVLDESGHPVSIRLRSKTQATSMIEEAMIAANETVAAHLLELDSPGVFRVHESPRPASLETLLPALKQLGYAIEGLGSGEPALYQRLLKTAASRPEGALVEQLVLRSMERAHYSTDPAPHFGLASKNYCHFTSPIRRYPDLMVHRLLRDPHAMDGELDWLASHCSKMERAAESAERDAVDLKLCEYMADRIGEEFEGTISNVTSRGFLVRLDNTAEGMVRFDTVHGEYLHFDPREHTLMGEETGRTFRLGMRMRVRILQVDVVERHIDLELV